ncbi:MAG: C25 family cysteine peptidase [Chitinophagales bacterium]|nr:hypothetical protein [Bacteroidota bacterium]MCB9042234.1 hypothetical protein [Chitinophagales bacterium]
MKKFHYLLLIGLLHLTAISAQTNFQNEWIHFNQNYCKFKVAEAAWVKIPYSTLAQTSLPLNGAGLRLYARGKEIPIRVSNEGAWTDNDYLEAWVTPNDGSFDALLFKNPTWQLHQQSSLFTDTLHYFLTWDTTAAQKPKHFTNAPILSASEIDTVLTHFPHTERLLFANQFNHGKGFTLSNILERIAEFGEGEGYVSGDLYENNTYTYTLNAPNACYACGTQAEIEIKVVGRNDTPISYPDHEAQIFINDVYCYNLRFDGFNTATAKFKVPVSHILPQTKFTFSVTDNNNGEEERFVLSYIKVSYPRDFTFEGQELQWQQNITQNTAINLETTTDKDNILILDNSLAEIVSPVGGSNIQYRFASNATARDLQIIDTTTVNKRTIEALDEVQFIDYSLPENQGNFILLSQTSLFGESLNNYLAYRNSAEGGNYTSLLVDVENLYDQFAWGIRKHPLAVRHFINYALANWQSPPEYLLLVGKSVSYEYFRSGGYQKCLVPTFGTPPSDFLLVAPSVYDYRPQIALGRLPVQNKNDIQHYLDKLMQYENAASAANNCTPQELPWQKKVLHLASGYNNNDSETYAKFLDNYVNDYEKSALGWKVIDKIKQASASIVPNPLIGQYFSEGVGYINYLGHPTSTQPIYWNIDLGPPQNYNNVGKYPFINANSCFSGNIHNNVGKVMAEDYILAQQAGCIGYMAVVNFGYPSYLNQFNEAFNRQINSNNIDGSVGNSMKNALHQIYSTTNNGLINQCQSLVYTGDPALVLPHWNLPDFAIFSENITAIPNNVNVSDESFLLKIKLLNLGKYLDDSIQVKIIRTLPNDAEQEYNFTIAAPSANEWLMLPISNDNAQMPGEHFFSIHLNPENSFEELCIDNNTAVFSLNFSENTCENISPQIALSNFTYCTDDDGIIALTATPQGGTFYINENAIGNTFSPENFSPGKYILSYEYTNPDNECSYIAHTTLHFEAAAQVSINAATSTCINTPTSFAYPNPNNLADSLIFWNFGADAQPATAQGAGPHVVSFSSSGSKTVQLSINQTACSNSLSRNIYVDNALQDVSISFVSASNNSITLQLSEAVSTFYGVYLNGLPFGAVYAPSTTLTVKNLAENQSYDIAVYATGNSSLGNACGFGATSNTINAQTLSCAPVEVSINNLNEKQCLNNDIVQIELLPAGGELSGNGIDSENLTFDPQKAGLGQHIITYTYTDDATGCKYELKKTVEVNFQPRPSINGDSILCSGGQISLEGLAGFVQYAWNTGDTNQVIDIDEGGDYILTVTDENACRETADWQVTEVPNLVPELNFPDSLEIGDVGILFDPELPDTLIYDWRYISDLFEEIHEPYVYIPPQNAYVSLTLSDGECSRSDSFFVVFISTGIENISRETLQLSPNPGKQYFTLYAPEKSAQIWEISLWDINGVAIQKWRWEYGDSFRFSCENCPAGMYFLRISEQPSGKLIAVQKLIKQ